MNWIEAIKNYNPFNEQEAKDRELILKSANQFDNILTRDNELLHMTSSGFIVNKSRDKILMVHHNIYNSWAWTGGHADGEEDLLQVAIKEAEEETGVKEIRPIISDIFALDIMPVQAHMKRGKFVSAHLHLNAAYLLEGDENEVLVVKTDENSGVKWIPINEVNLYSNEPHMHKIYNKIIDKMKGMNNYEQYH
ncbi:NUDIX hydrolase [Desnuesiella massiliensis]|uniref:NUDIX hydrolase n=1 Tax=Desnuesiella massiliensis TaxID=1650662 RepID=UPI0006E2FB33|nr:NUDIX hydrolase [Desnuesiella massiliensis]